MKGSEHQPVGCGVGGIQKVKESAGVGVKKKMVLLFGSGTVAKPAAEEFLKRADVKLVIRASFSCIDTLLILVLADIVCRCSK